MYRLFIYGTISVNLTKSSTIVIPAKAGIHSDREDGFLPAQE
jgi:hypothetical protein